MFSNQHNELRAILSGINKLVKLSANLINLTFFERKNRDGEIKERCQDIDENFCSASLSYSKIMKQLYRNKFNVSFDESDNRIHEKKLAIQFERGVIIGLNNNEENQLNIPIKYYSLATLTYNNLTESLNYGIENYNKCYVQKLFWLRTIGLKCNALPREREIIRSIQHLVKINLDDLFKESMVVTEKYLKQNSSSGDLVIDSSSYKKI